MPDPISAIAGSSVLGAGASLFGASKAADAQESAARQSADIQREMFNKQVELQAPFREAGLTAQNRLLDYLGLSSNATAPGYGSLAQSFGREQFTTDPGYDFRLKEGLTALDRQAAARGGLISGGALKAAQRYGQDYASNEYTNAFNRYQTERAAKLNPLQSLMGAGQTSANTLTSAAGGLGQGLGQAAVAGGTAQASGYLNQANAVTNALNQGTSSYMQNQYLNRLGGGGSNLSFLSPSQGGMGLV